MSRAKQLAALGLAIIWGPLAAQDHNPFDPRRVAPGPGASVASQPGSSGPKLAKAGVLCGIEQDLDRARLCVDGEWMGLSEFEARGGRRVKSLGAISVMFQDGKSQQLGETMRGWKARTARGKGEGK